jgi:DNA-binding transcriptional MerR regulator
MIKEEIKNKILNTIQKVTGVDLTTKTRKYEFIEARMIYYKLLRDRGYSLQEIGDTLDKNHATVLHAINVFEDIIEYDKDLMEKYSEAIQLLAGEKIDKYISKDDFAVEFADWLKLKTTPEDYYYKTIKDLLQIFKKEAGYE